MRVVCIGGGPAGLYFALQRPERRIRKDDAPIRNIERAIPLEHAHLPIPQNVVWRAARSKSPVRRRCKRRA